jgi:exodeoxyribonuclease VII large subunit
MGVVCRGRVTVYPPRGDYQLIVDHVEPRGLGALQKAFEQLKARLDAEGLFETARKKPVPFLPRRIAVITSPTGAVIRDILNVTGRRFPSVPILIVPVRVQGAEAPAEIIRALHDVQSRADVDCVVLARGGGSLEDLAPFNDEGVARAIARCRLPVISAVGHETDFTIADFVADLRAPTPSAAAELAVPVRSELLRRVDALTQRLARRQEQVLRGLRDRVRAAGGRLRHPGRVIGDLRLTVDDGVERLRRSLLRQTTVQRAAWLSLRMRLLRKDPRQTVRERRLMTGDYRGRLEQGWRSALGRARDRLKAGATLLASLSPLNVLNRGYSIVRRLPDGGILRRADAVAAGGEVAVQLSRGRLTARVLTIEQESEEWPRTGSKTRSTD